jgi:hypothetical protein
MTAPVHTPGPWKSEVSPTDLNATVRGARGAHVATVWSGSNPSLDVVAANAKLIAAAPDMLATLDRIAAGAEMTGEFSHAETVRRYQELARWAAAKARGSMA